MWKLFLKTGLWNKSFSRFKKIRYVVLAKVCLCKVNFICIVLTIFQQKLENGCATRMWCTAMCITFHNDSSLQDPGSWFFWLVDKRILARTPGLAWLWYCWGSFNFHLSREASRCGFPVTPHWKDNNFNSAVPCQRPCLVNCLFGFTEIILYLQQQVRELDQPYNIYKISVLREEILYVHLNKWFQKTQ